MITPFNPENLNPNSYDVTLNHEILTYVDPVLDPKRKNETLTSYIPPEGLILRPGELYIAKINEYTSSMNTVPIIIGKSSLARLGINIYATAGFGDIGYSGNFVLEISVVKPVKIYPNMKIGQIYWTEVSGTVDEMYQGKYNNETGVIASRSHQDFKK